MLRNTLLIPRRCNTGVYTLYKRFKQNNSHTRNLLASIDLNTYHDDIWVRPCNDPISATANGVVFGLVRSKLGRVDIYMSKLRTSEGDIHRFIDISLTDCDNDELSA